MENKRYLLTNLLLALLLVGVILLLLFSGLSANNASIVIRIRVSIIILSILVAAILALGGQTLQTLMGNPLAEPYILGVASGAGLGSVLAVFFSSGLFILTRTLFALVGAGISSTVIYLLANRKNGFSIGIALLAGVALNALFSSMILLFQSLFDPNDLRVSISWLMGNIGYLSWQELLLPAVGVLLILLFILRFGNEMDIYLSGDEMARSVGVDTAKLKKWGFISVSVSTALAVSVSGMIGFIGLIAPHLVRLSLGYRHKRLVLPLVLASSLLLLIAVFFSRRIMPGTLLPVGALTSLMGAPVFILILVKKYRGI